MVRSHSRPLRVVLAIVVSAGSGLAGPRQVPQVVKYLPVEHRPYDFAISPDGQFALAVTGTYVNPNNPGIGQPGKLYVFDLTSSVYAHQEYDIGLQVTQYSSDALDAVEDYALALGSDSQSANGGASLRLLLPLPPSGTLPNGGNFGVDSACVIDAASGHPFAVVRDWTGGGIWNLKTGLTPPVLATAPIPPSYWNPNLLNIRFGESLRLSDAVQSSSTHTIAISNSVWPGPYNSPPNHGFVGIASFDGQVNVTHGFTCTTTAQAQGGCPTPTTGAAAAVHDVAITPNGSMAVVSGNGFYGVFRMASGAKILDSSQQVPTLQSPALGFRSNPFNRITVDSVEVTNSRAVIIGTNGVEQDPMNGPYGTCPPPPDGNVDVAKWSIAIVNIRASPIAQVYFSDPVTPTCTPSRAHDVAITPNGNFAFVTTRVGTCRIDLMGWPVGAPQFFSHRTDPLKHGPGDAFVSDSIVCTNTKAVAIGRNIVTGGAEVCIYDVNQDPGAGSDIHKIVPLSHTFTLLPTDLVIDPTEKYVLVRSRSLDPQPTQFQLYGRVSIVDLLTGVLVAEFDQSASSPFGASWGVDQIEASPEYAITGGEIGQFQTATPSSGWIQLIRF